MSEEKRPILLAVAYRLPADAENNWTGYQSAIVYASRRLQHIRYMLLNNYNKRVLARELVSKGNIWRLRRTLEECEFIEPLEPSIVHQSMEELLSYYRQNILETEPALLIFSGRRWRVYSPTDIGPDESSDDKPIEPLASKRKRKRLALFSTSNFKSNENIQIQDRNT